MGKSLHELSLDLIDYVVDMHRGQDSMSGFNKSRYNNLKLEISSPKETKVPQLKISIGISQAIFNLMPMQKVMGSLGPDERYVYRWISRDSVYNDLIGMWKVAEEEERRKLLKQEEEN